MKPTVEKKNAIINSCFQPTNSKHAMKRKAADDIGDEEQEPPKRKKVEIKSLRELSSLLDSFSQEPENELLWEKEQADLLARLDDLIRQSGLFPHYNSFLTKQ